MNIIPLTDHRKVLINPTFNEIRDTAKKAGWRNWDTYPVWFSGGVKIIMRRK